MTIKIQQPAEKDIRAFLKALESSGILNDIHTIDQDEGKSRVLKELARVGLGTIHPDMLVCNSSHYAIVVKSE